MMKQLFLWKDKSTTISQATKTLNARAMRTMRACAENRGGAICPPKILIFLDRI